MVSLFGIPYMEYIAGTIAVAVFIFIFWYFAGNRSLSYGSSEEKRRLKGLGTIALFGTYMTGRMIYRALRGGIKGSIWLGKQAIKGGIVATKYVKDGKLKKLLRDSSVYISKLVKGEERNIEEELHQASAAAASFQLGKVVESLVNSEIREDQFMSATESRMQYFDGQLSSLTQMNDIDEEAKKFLQQAGSQLTASLVSLAEHEGLELNIRRKSFGEVYRLLKVVKFAENSARKIDSRAVRNQRTLSNYNQKELVDLQRYLEDQRKKSRESVRAAREAYRKASSSDRETKVALYQQVAMAQQAAAKTEQNVNKLQGILKQLIQANFRMLGALKKIRKDLKVVLQAISEAMSKEKSMQFSEKNLDKKGSSLEVAAKKANSDMRKIRDEEPEVIIINLTQDSSSILNGIAEIASDVKSIDEKEFVPLVERLLEAMDKAFQVEEFSRVANRYYSKLLKANEDFYRLVVEADLSTEVKASFSQELQIEEMEEKIASKEESVAEVTKSLFIRTRNLLQNSKGAIMQHVEYLSNFLMKHGRLKSYTLNILSALMQTITSHKVRVNAEFSARAQQYQENLSRVSNAARVAKFAA